jgi:hypothetical protein
MEEARRPSLPAGYGFAGIAPVRKALYVTEAIEVYELEGSGQPQGVLLLVQVEEAARAEAWLGAQLPRTLTVARRLHESECPRGRSGFALAVRGERMPDGGMNAPSDALERLFHGYVELVERTTSAGLFPRFVPALTWGSTTEGSVCTLLPDPSLPGEPERVRETARAFYRAVSGIDPVTAQGGPAPLARWCKFASAELTRVVDRCLSPPNGREAITTFAALARALGRAEPAGGPANEAPPATPAPSEFARGMKKVAGMRDLKELLQREVIGPLRDPEPYKKYGLSIPNGVLMYGPPGCGKTYIARQLAEELGHYFVEVIPSEVAGMYIHQSVIKIRELFDTAAEHAPTVLFIDEFEALVPPRDQLGGHQQYKAEEVNEFLAQLGTCADRNVFVIAATNQPERIDAAVRRTGRLDKHVYVGPPDADARREMLCLHLEGRPIAPDLDLAALAAMLDGYSASDLRFLVDEAARDALRARTDIGRGCFVSAMGRIRASVTPQVAAQYQSIEERGA